MKDTSRQLDWVLPIARWLTFDHPAINYARIVYAAAGSVITFLGVCVDLLIMLS